MLLRRCCSFSTQRWILGIEKTCPKRKAQLCTNMHFPCRCIKAKANSVHYFTAPPGEETAKPAPVSFPVLSFFLSSFRPSFLSFFLSLLVVADEQTKKTGTWPRPRFLSGEPPKRGWRRDCLLATMRQRLRRTRCVELACVRLVFGRCLNRAMLLQYPTMGIDRLCPGSYRRFASSRLLAAEGCR